MSVDPELMAAAAAAYPEEERDPLHIDALEEMRHLAMTTKDSRVKAQLLRILREEERLAAKEGSAENPLGELTDEEVHRRADEEASANLQMVLTEGSTLRARYPLTREVAEGRMAAIVAERVAAELAKLKEPDEFEARVAKRAAELAERIAEDRIDAMRADLEAESPKVGVEPEKEPGAVWNEPVKPAGLLA